MNNRKAKTIFGNDIDYAYVPEEFLKEFRDRIEYNRPARTCIHLEPNTDDTKSLLSMMKYREEVVSRELMIDTKHIINPFTTYQYHRLAQFKNKDRVNLCWFYKDSLVGPAMKVDK